ncbi:MAG: class I SAM-dependent methyltransferase, partial [Gammaproteobacteria bacterium]|nr:class I SAM-dependent methyltransferase [Gammaproteobacteria bacterium]
AALDLPVDRQVRLFEFAAGFGCVSRHLKNNERFDTIACDIHPKAISFLRDELKMKTFQSAHLPEDFKPGGQHDVIFALSFFSHMPRETFGRWLKSLYDALGGPGYLIFTTHGSASLQNAGNPELSEDGFWFAANSEQDDLDGAEYGTAMSMPDFVISEIYKQTGAPIVMYKYAHWWEHQDLWVVKREI